MGRKTRAIVAGLLAAALVAVAAVVALGQLGDDEEISGSFSMVIMVHSGESPGGFDIPGTAPWDGEATEGTFNYRSIPCDGDAPVNNIASDLPSYGAQVQDSRVPVSMRAHPLEFELAQGDNVLEMTGRLTATVCKLGPGPTVEDDPVPDEDKPQIHFDLSGDLDAVSPEAATVDGSFELAGGTDRYEQLSGSGDIAGYFFCFAPDGCQGGDLADGQFVLRGEYSHPDPGLDDPEPRAEEPEDH
jgi:hypothetical protein